MLNEYLSDQMLERLSGLLMRQMMEKESKLKALVQKYMDEVTVETNSIRGNFKVDYDKLTEF